MGFYGTLTSSAKTNMQIDKHYSNRSEMDKNVKDDGVYAGRYVIVEYSISRSLSDFILLYEKNGKFYDTIPKDDGTTPEVTSFVDKQIYKVIPSKDFNAVINDNYEYVLYIGVESEKNKVTLIKATSAADKTGFTHNFLIDQAVYATNNGAFKGYDSTVWQKIYENGNPTYINIAELNSVIPTFGVTVDAPTDKPKAPHFDKNSTNIYYDIHFQPSWGFRVAAASAKSGTTVNDNNDGWDKNLDDNKSNQAIYYNEAGFNEKIKSYIEEPNDFITVKPTGISGYDYNISEAQGEHKTEKRPDIQEFRLYLPSIGNMVSKGWDAIHGPDRDDNPGTSLQGRLNFFSGIAYKDSNGIIVADGIKAKQIPVQSIEGYLIGVTPTSDDWITLNTNSTQLYVNHKNALTTNTTDAKVNDSQTPGFGNTFTIPYVTYDSKGHISSHSTTSVTIPEIIVANSTDSTGKAEVLTSIGYSKTNDNITSTKQTVGSLLLTGYSIANVAAAVASTDTVNSAFGKLQKSLNEEASRAKDAEKVLQENIDKEAERASTAEKALGTRIDNLNYNNTSTTQIIKAIKQDKGAISVERASVGTMVISDFVANATGGALSVSDTINSALGKLEYNINAENTRASEAEKKLNERIDNLDYSDTADDTQIIQSINQADGLISISRAPAGNLKLTNYSISTTGGALSVDDTLNSAFGKLEFNLNKEAERAAAAETALGNRIDTLFNDANPDDLDSIVDFVNWTIEHGTEAASMAASIKDNSEAIAEETKRAQDQEKDIRKVFAEADTNINTSITNLKDGSESTIKDLDEGISTLEKNLDDTAKAIREEFAAVDKATGEAVAAVSELVGETSVSNQIDAKLVNYYTKNEVNNELNNYSTSTTIAENYYNKSEIDTTLQNYATVEQIPTDFYSKSEIDTTFESYAKIEQIPTDFYSKAEVDALISDLQTQITELKALVEGYHPTTEEPTPEEEVTPEETPTE